MNIQGVFIAAISSINFNSHMYYSLYHNYTRKSTALGHLDLLPILRSFVRVVISMGPFITSLTLLKLKFLEVSSW